MLNKYVVKWHQLRARYHEILLADCLDATLKKAIMKKLTYHRNRLYQLQTPEAP